MKKINQGIMNTNTISNEAERKEKEKESNERIWMNENGKKEQQRTKKRRKRKKGNKQNRKENRNTIIDETEKDGTGTRKGNGRKTTGIKK